MSNYRADTVVHKNIVGLVFFDDILHHEDNLIYLEDKLKYKLTNWTTIYPTILFTKAMCLRVMSLSSA